MGLLSSCSCALYIIMVKWSSNYYILEYMTFLPCYPALVFINSWKILTHVCIAKVTDRIPESRDVTVLLRVRAFPLCKAN